MRFNASRLPHDRQSYDVSFAAVSRYQCQRAAKNNQFVCVMCCPGKN